MSMTPVLVGAGAFSQEPFILLDVGARGGIKQHWRVFGDDLRFIGCDADPDETEKLKQNPASNTKILPFGLAGQSGRRVLHIHNNPSSSSLYEADPAFLDRMLLREAAAVARDQTIEVRRLDDVAAEIGDVDFVDLDAEGAELEIMQGGAALLARSETLGIHTEVRFMEGLGTPLFWQTDQFLRGLGFSLYDLDYARESRRALPFPMLIDQRHDSDPGLRIFGSTIGGQLAYGNALYLRDIVGTKRRFGTTKLLKLACLFEIFGMNDSAAELILAHKEEIDRVRDHRELLDALVPVSAGKRLSYDAYCARFFRHDLLLRSGDLRVNPKIQLALRTIALRYLRAPRLRRIAGMLGRLLFPPNS